MLWARTSTDVSAATDPRLFFYSFSLIFSLLLDWKELQKRALGLVLVDIVLLLCTIVNSRSVGKEGGRNQQREKVATSELLRVLDDYGRPVTVDDSTKRVDSVCVCHRLMIPSATRINNAEADGSVASNASLPPILSNVFIVEAAGEAASWTLSSFWLVM